MSQNTINPDLALESWKSNRQKFLQSHNLDSTRFSNSFFSKNTALSSFFKVPIFNFLLLLHFCTRKCYFSSIQSNSEWPELTESAVGLERPRKSISYFFSSTSFKYPLPNQSIAFQMKQTVDSKKSWKLSFTSDFESWLTICAKSSFSVELSWYSKSTVAKTTLLNSPNQVWFDGDIFLNFSSKGQILTMSFRFEIW